MMRLLRLPRARHSMYAVMVALGAVILAVHGVGGAQTVEAQAADSIYVSTATGTYGVGSSFTVAVRENSSTSVNAVQSDLSYSSNLQFVSIDASGSAFGIDASSTGGGGSVSMARGTTSPVSGDQLVAKITFKVLSAGTGTVTVQNSSMVLSSTTNSDVVTARNGGSYSLQAGGAVSPTPTTTSPAAAPTPSTPGTTTGRKTTNLPSTTIAPQGSAQTTALPGDAAVELETPATIVTTPDPTRSVTKVEYLINGKVVATDVEAPYTHSVDSTKYRNGTYTLTTKTYYTDGKVDTSNASLIVKNKFGAYQLWLQLQHYAWIVVILLIILAELVYLKFFRRRKPPVGGANYGPPASGGNPFGPSAPNGQAPQVNPSVSTSAAGPVISPTTPAPVPPAVQGVDNPGSTIPPRS